MSSCLVIESLVDSLALLMFLMSIVILSHPSLFGETSTFYKQGAGVDSRCSTMMPFLILFSVTFFSTILEMIRDSSLWLNYLFHILVDVKALIVAKALIVLWIFTEY